MPNPVIQARSMSAARSAVSAWHASGARVGLVPTMGALHGGHLSLVALLKKTTDKVIVSIFVNPSQFAQHADFEAYPRTEERDLQLLASIGVDLAFLPDAREMYPADFASSPNVSGVADMLEGVWRPGFFGGVATIVTKLLSQCGADAAAFGEKDYQQLLIIKRLVKYLDIPTEIIGGPTCREADGLAMSSRNVYLSPEQRVIAGKMNLILQNAGKRALNGAAPDLAEAEAADALRVAGFDSVDYVSIADAETLHPFGQHRIDRPGRILAAAHIGKTRLIDNFPIIPQGLS